jgi:glycosyltransferase
MKLSIITVTYNSEKYIGHCINSVLSQTFSNVEYIIIDGNSTDQTINIINKYSSKIDIFISEPDNGIYDAMNKGIKLATGDVIGILNSDDIYTDQEVFNDVMSHFLNDTELYVLYGNLFYVEKEDLNKIVRKWTSVSYFNKFFELAFVPPHPALFVHKNVYKQAGLFDLQYKLSGDYEFMLRILKRYNFKSKYIDRWMVKMRLGGASNKSLKNIFDGNKEILRAWKSNGLKAPNYLMPLRVIKKLKQFNK